MEKTNQHIPLKHSSVSERSQDLISRVKSLAIAGTAILLSFYVLQSHIDWRIPFLATLFILLLIGLNFIALVSLEEKNTNVSAMCVPVMITFILLSMVYLLTETADRFLYDFGFGWLKPVMVGYLLLCCTAIFKDKELPVKVLFALNGIAMAVLWNLCASGKMAWMF